MREGTELAAEPRVRLAICTDAWEAGGGAERVLFTLLSGLDRERFEPVVFALFSRSVKPTFLTAAADELGVRVVSLRLSPGLRLGLIRDLARFLGELGRGRFAAVHGSADRGLGVIAGRLVGIPVRIETIHNTFARRSKVEYWLRLVSLRWFATTVAAVSRATAQVLRDDYGVSPAKLIVVLNGVDDSVLLRGRSPAVAGSREGGARILTVARLVREKRLDLLIEAFALVAGEIEGAELDIVGDGPLRLDLEEQARALGLSRQVTFHGRRDEIGEYLLAADVFALTSRSEGLGVAAIEAMAVSKPVVCSTAGGLPEVVLDGETGLLVTLGGGRRADAVEMAAAILTLLTDPALARRMGRAGRRRFEEVFSVAAFVSKYESLYRGLQPSDKGP